MGPRGGRWAAYQPLVEIRTSPDKLLLGRRIDAAMSDHQVTAEDLAKVIGRSERYVCKCLRHPGRWGAAELVALVAPALGISRQALFEGDLKTSA